MRNKFAGLALAVGLIGGMTWAQEVQPRQPQVQPQQPQTQPQVQPTRPDQGTVRQGQPGQQVQPGQQLQPPGQQLQPGQQRGQLTQQGGQTTSADQQIAAKIHGGSHNEIELSKFAQTKLQSPEARGFAEKMVRDHTADAESYQRWAGKQGDAGVRQDEVATAAAPRGGALDWNKIHEQVAQQCLASAKQELGRHQGSQFDQAYMGMQLGGHMHMQDELKVLRNYASPELQQQIDKSLQVVQGHLQEARVVMETLKDRPSERVSRRPEDKK
jgi:predicted outer membrane protein